MRRHSGLVLGVLALAFVMFSLPSPGLAGLQKWSLVHLDATGGVTSPGKAASVETWASDQRGFTVAIGCDPDGGHTISVMAPEGNPSDFAGPEMEPSLRVSKPGTDLFLGPIGKLQHDGKRYIGHLPEPAAAPLGSRIKDGLLAVTEFGTRTTVSLKTQSLEHMIQQLDCK